MRVRKNGLSYVLTAALAFTSLATLSRAYGNIIADGGFEGIYTVPTMYAHENARIKVIVDAGWDVGGKESYRFPAQWSADPAPAGYLRVSTEAHSGMTALEFGKGGTIYSTAYTTPTGGVGKYPLPEGRSCVIRVWAKGTGSLIARIREFDAGDKRLADVAVGTPETLSADWREFIFLYPPGETAPATVQLAFTADGLAKVDDASMLDVVEFNHLTASLSEGVKTVQADAKDGLVQTAAVEAIAAEVNAVLLKTKDAALTLPGQLALRDEIAPIAQRLDVMVWEGKGQRAGRIGLVADRFKVEFYGEALKFRLAALADPAKKVAYLNPFGSEVWRIKLVNPAWKSGLDPAAQPPSQLYLTSDSKCASLKSDLAADSRKLTLNWLGVEVPGSAETLDVTVTVALPQGARLSRWHIKVSGGLKNATVNEVHFPMLATLAPMTAAGEGDFLAVPDGTGRLIKNPYQLKSFTPGKTMQFWALYSEKAGLYFAAEDGDSYIKDFNFAGASDEKTLHTQIANFPDNNMTVGNAYDMPYDAVIGSFDGTWWDASKIYRKWALEQKWCKAFGPLHSSKDTPQWYKDLPIWVLLYETGFVATTAVEEEVLSGKITGATAGRYKTLYEGVPFALHYYGWELGHKGYGQGGYTPAFGMKGWPMLIKQLQENGARVVPYVQGSLFNTRFDWYTKQGGDKGAVYFSGGAPIIYDERPNAGYECMTWMCQASSQWQEMHAGVAKMLATCGVNGIYYDSFPGWFQCYNPAHGHTLGGGKYLAAGNRDLIARTRAAAKAINPDMIFVSESPHETIVGALDGCLQFQYASQRDNIPLFSSVYHDFILLWGNTYGANYDADYEKWAFIPVACSFIRGDQLGWFGEGNLSAGQYTSYLARLRMGPARKFVTYGEMVEPPRFLNQLPTVSTPPWFKNSEKEPRSFPAVLLSTWKTSDQSLGLVFANIAETEQEVEYEIDANRYGLPIGEKYVVTDVVGKTVLETSAVPVIRRKDKIAPRQVLILQISAEGTDGAPGAWRSLTPDRSMYGAYPLFRVKVGERDATVILPAMTAKTPAALPWVVYHTGAGEDCDAILGGDADISKGPIIKKLLENGFLVCSITSGKQHWGNVSGEEAHEALYQYMLATFPVRPKVNLLAQSMGGTSAYPWASRHPERVAHIYGIYPITNLASMGDRNPIKNLKPLAEHKIAIMHRHGLADKSVPFELNAKQLEEAYKNLGGTIQITAIPDIGHQYSPLIFVADEVATFFLSPEP